MVIPDISKLSGNLLGRLYIKKHYPEFHDYLIERYKHIPWKKFPELLYCYLHNLSDRPKCKMCNNPVDFISMTDGYREYCSVNCMRHDPDIIDTALNTMRKHFGDDLSEITEKVKKTKMERYGDPNYNNTDKNRETKMERYGDPNWRDLEKTKKTCMERYGVEYPMRNRDICDKSIQTRKTIYGEGNITNHKKTKKTCMERYGVDNVFQLDDVKEKSKKTCMERYGVEHPMQLIELRKKAQQTRLSKYGDPNYNNRDKYKKTSISRYGVENPGGTEESIEKIKSSTLQRYNVEWYTQTSEYKEYMKDNKDEIQEKIYQTKKQNHTFSTSSVEIEFKQWLDDNNIEYIYQYKSKEYPFNCDFYFPQTDSYLEIQGSWTHGKHPFNPEDNNDVDILKLWESKDTAYYNNAIYVWTVRDPQKRKCAKEHNLKWTEVFTNDVNELIKLNIW